MIGGAMTRNRGHLLPCARDIGQLRSSHVWMLPLYEDLLHGIVE